MRPRIDELEAKFLVEVLEKDKANYDQLSAQLDEKMKPLKTTVSKACWYVRNYMLSTAEREFGYPDCAKQLCQLEAEQTVILRKVIIYKRLLAKYRQISEGTKRQGRYSMTANDITSEIHHLNDNVFLSYKDYKMPMQVEAPKI